MKARRLAALASIVALAAACGSTGASSPRPGPAPGSSSSSGGSSGSGASEARSALSRDTSPSIGANDLASVVAGNNAFALELHRRLVEAGANMMTSPFSVSSALAMSWAGARGATATQLAGALHFALPQAQLHPAFDALDLALKQRVTWCGSTATPFTLNLVNTAWAQDGYPFVPAYLDTLAVSYGAGLPLVDFVRDAEAARQKINDAVASDTEGRIKDLLGPGAVDRTTRLVLTNAVYFKGNWANEFDPASTTPGAFRVAGGSAVDVPFMHGHLLARGAAQPAYDAVELPYACSNFAMTIIAPKAGTFETFEAALDVAGLASVDAAMAESEVTLSLPRFGFRWGTRSLKAPLQALGMTDAFTPGRADFTGIAHVANDPLYVGDVVHQTFVAVGETGTEAAAATAAILAGGSAPTPRPSPPAITVNVDRPFLFLIRNTTTGQILFVGRVMNPR